MIRNGGPLLHRVSSTYTKGVHLWTLCRLGCGLRFGHRPRLLRPVSARPLSGTPPSLWTPRFSPLPSSTPGTPGVSDSSRGPRGTRPYGVSVSLTTPKDPGPWRTRGVPTL